MRCINLLETPTSGDVLFHGESVISGKVNASAYRAKVGMVFQSFNLFDNMSVLKNCVVGQVKVLGRARREAEAERELGVRFLQQQSHERRADAHRRRLRRQLHLRT